jgi:type IV pilus assembly protein PilB
MSAVATNTVPLTGLARALVQFNALSQAEAERLSRKASEAETEFIDELLAAKLPNMTAAFLAKTLSDSFGHPLTKKAAKSRRKTFSTPSTS